MRVITGTARGRRLAALEGDDVRPTTDRIKEAIFSAIQFETEGRRVLDLFAGSGQLGIEALSRGAEKAVFVDNSKASVSVIRSNIDITSFNDRSEVITTDAKVFLKSSSEKFHIIFLDPPYKTGLLQSVLPDIPSCLAPGGIVICEHPVEEVLPDNLGELKKKSYKYGKIAVDIYR